MEKKEDAGKAAPQKRDVGGDRYPNGDNRGGLCIPMRIFHNFDPILGITIDTYRRWDYSTGDILRYLNSEEVDWPESAESKR